MKARQLARVALGLALGTLAALVPCTSPWGSPRGDAGPPPGIAALALGPGGLEDATRGRLEEVVVHYAPAMGEQLAAVYSRLFAALEPDTTVHVVVPGPTDFTELEERLARLGQPVRAKLETVPVGHPVTGWAKDRFVSWVPAADSRAERILLIPPRPAGSSATRGGDWEVPGDLAARSAGRCRSAVAPLVFDGGDFAAAGSTVLAGWTLMAKNPGLAAAPRWEAERFLTAIAGRPVLLLGSRDGDVPEHHVNMFAIPLDDGRALVGDPELAAAALGGEETARTRLAAAGIDGDFSPVAARRFDRAAADLEDRGFRVTRVPSIPLAGHAAYGPFVTYTNALIETFADGRRRVYLPTYGIVELDRLAAGTWERSGFEVRPVDVGPIFRSGGTLDCLVGVIRRSSREEA